MSEKLHKRIFSTTPCLTEEQLRHYVEHTMSAAERHITEKHLIDCELCADATEGYALLQNKQQSINQLKQLINQRTLQTKNTPHINWYKQKRTWAIAASLGLLMISAYMLVYFFNQTNNNVAVNEPAKKNTLNNVNEIQQQKTQTSTEELRDVKIEAQQKELTQPIGEKKTNEKTNFITPQKSTESEPATKTEILAKTEADKDDNGKTSTQAPVPSGESSGITHRSAENREEAITTERKKDAVADLGTKKAKAEEDEKVSRSASKSQAAKNTDDYSREAIQEESSAPPQLITQETAQQTGPSFPGGDKEMMKYINENKNTALCDCKGKIEINITVSSTGEIIEVRPTLHDKNCECLVNEATRIFKNMPQWKPATLNGKTVKMSRTISFVF